MGVLTRRTEFLAGYTPPAGGDITLVQSAQGGAGPASSVGVAYGSALTAGSFLVASCAVFEGSDGDIGISDSAGHTWTAVAAEQETSDGFSVLRSWTAPNSGTATPTVTFTHNTGGFFAGVVAEFTNVDAVTPLDGVTPVSTSGSTDFSPATTLSTTNITPATNNACLVGVASGVWATTGDPVFTVTNGTIIQERETFQTDFAIATAYKLQTTAAAEAVTWTVDATAGGGGGASPWVAHVFVLRRA